MTTTAPRTIVGDYDVVIVGGGNAALTETIAAHESGARVIVLEAAPYAERGGNSRFTGAIFRTKHDGIETLRPLLTEESKAWCDRGALAPNTAEDYLADWKGSSDGRNDDALTSTTVHRSLETVTWMAGHGVRWGLSVGKLIDTDSVDPTTTYTLPPGGAFRDEHEGVSLTEDLYAAVERLGIDVLYDSPVVDLVTSGTACLGVDVHQPTCTVRVLGVVVLAAGGFEANPEMRLRWLEPGGDLVQVRGTRFNTSAVLRAALKSGAKAEGHWGGCHAVPIDLDDAPMLGDIRLTDKMRRYSYPYAVLVNTDGERFVDEGENQVWLTYAKTGSAIRAQRRAWAAQIFDPKTPHLLEPRPSTGTPVVAETLEKLGIDPGSLRQTIDTFNAGCTDGTMNPFGLDAMSAYPEGQLAKSNWAQPNDRAPFVAYAVTSGITFTYGGVRIYTDDRVRDDADRVMPGLYPTGEITGGFFFHNYPAGAGLMRGAVFGRIAGTNAAVEAARVAKL